MAKHNKDNRTTLPNFPNDCYNLLDNLTWQFLHLEISAPIKIRFTKTENCNGSAKNKQTKWIFTVF